YGTFARMRSDAPLHWTDAYGADKGFWSLTRYADIMAAQRDPETFSSAQGIRIEDQSREEYMARRTFQETDPPEHTATRRTVNPAFAKPVVAQFEPLRWFRVPARAWLVVVMVAPLLAGYGLQTLMHITDEWRDEPPKFVFWLRLAAAGAAGVFAVCGVTLLTAGMVELPQSAAALMIFDGLAVGAVLLIVLLQRGRATIVALSFIMVTFADVAVTGVQWLEWRGPDAWVEPYADVATFIREDDAGYVYSPSYAIPQEAAEYYGLRLFYGVDPFQLQAFVDVMAQASNVPVEGYSITLPPLTGIETDDDIPFANRDIRPDVETLAQYGVSHVVAAYAIEADELSLAEQINGLNVYRNALYSPEVEPPVLIPPYTVEQTNRVTILSVWVSAVSFVLMGAAIALLSVREARNE
ncbi:MAG: hypothetical protein AAFV33_21730, partial [Chloroflexota bacterium]